MNGKYMRQAEMRWQSHEEERLEHIRAKREKKMPPCPQYVRQLTPFEKQMKNWQIKCTAAIRPDDLIAVAIHATASGCKTEDTAIRYLLYAVASGEMTVEESIHFFDGGLPI